MERVNVFRINADPEVMRIDHGELAIRRESAALEKEKMEVNGRYGKQMLRSLFSETKGYIFLVLAMLFSGLLLFVSLASEMGFRPILAIISGVVFLVALILLVLKRRRNGNEEERVDSKLKEIDDEYGRLCEISEKELGIPSDAKKLEIMTYYYHGEKPEEKEEIVNDDMRLFEEDGMICFYWGGAVYGVSRDSIEALVKVEEEITFPEWWKEEPFDGEKYAQYGIRKNGGNEYLETFSADFYYSLRFSKDGTDFEIVIPPYEIETALEVLKIRPVTE